jgi:hypothetical protein
MKGMLVALVLLMGPYAFSCDHDGMSVEQKVEMHQKMSQTHAAVAECLKAGKPESECHQLMKDSMGSDEKGMSCPHKKGHKHKS